MRPILRRRAASVPQPGDPVPRAARRPARRRAPSASPTARRAPPRARTAGRWPSRAAPPARSPAARRWRCARGRGAAARRRAGAPAVRGGAAPRATRAARAPARRRRPPASTHHAIAPCARSSQATSGCGCGPNGVCCSQTSWPEQPGEARGQQQRRSPRPAAWRARRPWPWATRWASSCRLIASTLPDAAVGAHDERARARACAAARRRSSPCCQTILVSASAAQAVGASTVTERGAGASPRLRRARATSPLALVAQAESRSAATGHSSDASNGERTSTVSSSVPNTRRSPPALTAPVCTPARRSLATARSTA